MRFTSRPKMNYMPGTASLIEDIDKKHLVLLRDGRTLIGFLRSIDQFGIQPGAAADGGEDPRGQEDLEKESDTSLQQVCIEDILEEQRLQQQSRQEAEKTKHLALKERGLVMPRSDIMDEYGVQHQY
ncbi:U6 snRNA-associated Sm-like protein LSm1 isoform X2 [Oncorhynchus kisutch]|uniref:U6 snRNA-associated Sm-like protein LSm1 isoform X2 n=1 Tax=Oncorhynchus kisutch TaxID=8019 RepID=UPI00099F77E4|nr:U6 snRNA-associated Sm-like protein LSm1 isoform X2 [Oncorhynchus kisutch]